MSCISFSITVVVDVFTEILIYRLRSLFVKEGKTGVKKHTPLPPDK